MTGSKDVILAAARRVGELQDAVDRTGSFASVDAFSARKHRYVTRQLIAARTALDELKRDVR